MKKILILIASIFSFFVAFDVANAEQFNVATYNVFSKGYDGNGMSSTQLNSIRNTISNEQLDLVGMQELDLHNTHGRNIGKDILYDISKGIMPYQVYGQSLDNNGGYFNNGIMSNLQVKSEYAFYLPNSNNLEQRSYQKVTIQKNGYYASVYNTHLQFGIDNKSLRESQIKNILTALENDPIPNKIIMGDLNISSTSELSLFENAGYKIVKDSNNQYIPTNGSSSIDFIIVSPNIEIISSGVKGDSVGSDHKMLHASLNINNKGTQNLRFEGNIMFTIGKSGYLINAQEYVSNKRTTAWEYYPNTVYGNHGKNIEYRFNIASYGNVVSAYKKKQGTTIAIRKYTYYPNAKYGIHGQKIKTATDI